MAKNNKKYVNFPISFIRLLYINDIDPTTLLDQIIDFAIVNQFDNIKIDDHEAARQALYGYYRDVKSFNNLYSKINDLMEMDSVSYDEDYQGFNGSEFNPESGIVDMLEVFKEDNEFRIQCRQYGKFRIIRKTLRIKGPNFDQAIKNHDKLSIELTNFEEQYGKDAWASIQTKIIIDAIHGKISLPLFRLIVAVKSIIGKRNFNKTYKSVLLSRMSGCKTDAAITPEMEEEYEYYKKRYPFNKLMNSAIHRGFFTKLSAGRGYFISTKYSVKELQEAIKNRKQKWQDKQEEMERASAELKRYQKELKSKKYHEIKYQN